jgi:hypothetical protein
MTLAIRRAPLRHNEAGFALATAMFALAVIGVLVAGGFLAGRVEQQSGLNVTYSGQAREAAEAGLAESMSTLDAPALSSLVAGGAVLDLGTRQLVDAVTVHTTVARLTSRLYLVRAQGTRHDLSGGALATRTLGVLVEVEADEASPQENAVTPLAERSWLRRY